MARSGKVCIVGAGAMGGFYASKLAAFDPECVFFLAGGERFERLQREGVTVNGRRYRLPVRRPEDEGPAAELVVLTVKYHHLGQAIEDMQGVVGKETVILSLMNGIDSEEALAGRFGWERVVYGVALGIDALRDGSTVRTTQEGMVYLGEEKNDVLSPKVRQATSWLESAAIEHTVPKDMLRVMWWKFMINVGVNQVSAVLRAPFAVFQRTEEACRVMRMAMREVVELAGALRIELTDEDLSTWEEIMARLAPDGRTSMCQDVEAKRKTEVEMLGGKMIELGREHGVAVPVNEVLFHLIRSMEQSYDILPA